MLITLAVSRDSRRKVELQSGKTFKLIEMVVDLGEGGGVTKPSSGVRRRAIIYGYLFPEKCGVISISF